MKVIHQPRQSARKEWLILPLVAVSSPQPYLIPKESGVKGHYHPKCPVKLLNIFNQRFQITSSIQKQFHIRGKPVNHDCRKQVK